MSNEVKRTVIIETESYRVIRKEYTPRDSFQSEPEFTVERRTVDAMGEPKWDGVELVRGPGTIGQDVGWNRKDVSELFEAIYQQQQ